MAETFDITIKHPEYAAQESAWQAMRDAFNGEDAVKEKGDAYLPMKAGIRTLSDAGRKAEAYKDYKDRAEFPEIVAPTVQGSVGLVHSKPTEIKLPKGLEYLNERATADGLTLEGLHQRITSEVMQMGRYGLLAGVNEGGEFHVATYTAETIPNWDTDAGDLSLLVLNESGQERDQDTNQWEKKDRYRECYLSEGKYVSRVWEKTKGEDGKDTFTPGEEEFAAVRDGSSLNEIPFVAVGSKDLTLSPDKMPLYGLAKLAYRTYRLDADYVNALHMTGEPTPWVSGIAKDDAPSTIGASSLWVLPAEGAQAGMLEFTGQGLGAQEKAISNTLARAIMFGAQLFADDSKTAESGEALRLRLGNQQSTLKTVAKTVAAGLEKILKHIAVWAGLNPDDVEVVPKLDFVEHALGPQEILALVAGWQSGAYSKQTLFENLQRGEIVKSDASFEEEEEKIGTEPPALAGEGLSLGG